MTTPTMPVMLSTANLMDRPVNNSNREMKSKAVLGQLRKDMWLGQRCFIVGGGPSLKGFDFSILRGELTIGINRAFEKFDPTILFGMDSRLWKWIEFENVFGPEVRDKFVNFSHGIKAWMGMGGVSMPDDFVTLPDAGLGAFTCDLEDGVGSGNNSGYAALNLAYILGADPIYLLGYDMHGDGTGGQSWFHSGYPLGQTDRVYDDFKNRIETVAAPELNRTRRVVNLNPKSALKCFPSGRVVDLEKGYTPVVVGYYTEDTGYEKYAQNLKESLKPWGLERDIVGVPSLGSWQKNTQYKANMLLDMLDKYPGKPLLYLDADATMDKYPGLLLELARGGMVRIAAHMRGGVELLSGTLWLDGSDECREIVKAWAELNSQNPNTWDQKNLQQVVKGIGHHFFNLPPEYCAIFDLMPEAGECPVITQWQASRILKKEVGA